MSVRIFPVVRACVTFQEVNIHTHFSELLRLWNPVCQILEVDLGILHSYIGSSLPLCVHMKKPYARQSSYKTTQDKPIN